MSESNSVRQNTKLDTRESCRVEVGERAQYRRPIETPYGTFESMLAAARYTNAPLSLIHYRLKTKKPGWRYVTI